MKSQRNLNKNEILESARDRRASDNIARTFGGMTATVKDGSRVYCEK